MPTLPPPSAAAALFGNLLPVAAKYADRLVGEGVHRGLIGPNEAERIWWRHLINCAAPAALIPTGAYVVDLGSGAGLPGIPLAIARPDLQIVLIESLLRRAAFLSEVVTDLELVGVTVRRARAEELASARLAADVVIARAVASVARLCRWAVPLLAPDGSLIAIKGEGVMDELAAEWRSIRSSGFTGDIELLSLDIQGGQESPRTARGDVGVTKLGQWSGEAAEHSELSQFVVGENADRAALVLRLSRRPQPSGQHGPSGRRVD